MPYLHFNLSVKQNLKSSDKKKNTIVHFKIIRGDPGIYKKKKKKKKIPTPLTS